MTQIAFYLFSGILLFSGSMVIFARNPVHSVLYLILAFFNAAGLFILLGAEFLAMLLVVVYVGAVAVLFLFVVMMLDIAPLKKRPGLLRYQLEKLSRAFLSLMGYLVQFLIISYLLSSLFIPVLDIMLATVPTKTVEVGCGLFTPVLAYLILRYLFKKSFFQLSIEFMKYLPGVWMLGIIMLAELSYVMVHWESLAVREGVVLVPTPDPQQVTNTQALGKIIYTDYSLLFETVGFILLVAMIGAIVLTHRKRDGVKRQNVRNQIMRRKEDTLKLHDVPLGKGV
jgi:NADH:ubiquinone oxidoreductase subunit 6 (subunit J)